MSVNWWHPAIGWPGQSTPWPGVPEPTSFHFTTKLTGATLDWRLAMRGADEVIPCRRPPCCWDRPPLDDSHEASES